MTTKNTLLGSCITVYHENYQEAFYNALLLHAGTEVHKRYRIAGEKASRFCFASVLDHLAAEITVMLERNPNLTPHQLITILRMEAASELAGWEQELA
jgi:hypothetical protein